MSVAYSSIFQDGYDTFCRMSDDNADPDDWCPYTIPEERDAWMEGWNAAMNDVEHSEDD